MAISDVLDIGCTQGLSLEHKNQLLLQMFRTLHDSGSECNDFNYYLENTIFSEMYLVINPESYRFMHFKRGRSLPVFKAHIAMQFGIDYVPLCNAILKSPIIVPLDMLPYECCRGSDGKMQYEIGSILHGSGSLRMVAPIAKVSVLEKGYSHTANIEYLSTCPGCTKKVC